MKQGNLVVGLVGLLVAAGLGLPLHLVANALGLLGIMLVGLGVLVGAPALVGRFLGPAIALLLLAGAWPAIVAALHGGVADGGSRGGGVGELAGLLLLLGLGAAALWLVVRIRALLPPVVRQRPAARRRSRLTEPDPAGELTPPPRAGERATDELHLLDEGDP